MSNWIYKGSSSYTGKTGSVDLNFALNGRSLIIDIDSAQKKDTWNISGAFVQVINLGFIPEKIEVSETYRKVSFNPSLLKFQPIANSTYGLRFKPVPWLTNFSIRVWEDTYTIPNFDEPFILEL